MEERKIILDLLLENKIDRDEAVRLLEALDKNKRHYENANKNFENTFKKFGKSVDKFSDKAVNTYKDYEPVINDTADKVKDSVEKLYKKYSKKAKSKFSKDADIFEYDDFDDDDVIKF